MRHPLAWLLVPVALGLVVSCTDDTPTAPDSSSPSQGTTPVDLVATPRFTIELSAEGTFMPGQPITIKGSVLANLSTADVEIRVILPELEGFRVAGPSGRLPVQTNLAPAVLERVPLDRAQRHPFSTTVSVPQAGYYRVAVSARKRSSEPSRTTRGTWIQDVEYEEGWLWVDERGGAFTRSFNALTVPDTVIPVPGPRRLKGGRGQVRGAVPPSGINPTGPVEGCDVYHVVYWNADANGGAGAYEVLDGTYAEVNITDDQTGQIIGNASQGITSDGEVVVCTWQGVGYSGTIKLTSLDGNTVNPDPAHFGGGMGRTTSAVLIPKALRTSMVYTHVAMCSSTARFRTTTSNTTPSIHQATVRSSRERWQHSSTMLSMALMTLMGQTTKATGTMMRYSTPVAMSPR